MKKLVLSFCVLMLSVLANAQNPYPVVPIDTVQYVNMGKLTVPFPNDSSDYVNPFFKNSMYTDTVRFDGIVLFDPRLYGLSTSRKATVLSADTFGRPWGGVEIMCEPSGSGRTLAQLLNDNKFYDNLKPGTRVRATGVIRTFRGTAPAGTRQGQSQVNMIRGNINWDNGIEILDLEPKTVTATPIRIDSLMTGNAGVGQVQNKVSGEQWEGSYVELRDVTVFSRQASGSRWFWSVADENGNAIDVSDFSAWFRNDNNSDSVLTAGRFAPPLPGTRISYMRGVIVESAIGGQYRFTIAPLLPTDIGPVSYTPPTVSSRDRFPVVAKSTDSVGVLVKVQQGTARVNNVRLFYAVGYNTTTFDSITLTRNTLPNDTMQFFGFIPAQANGSVVKYFVRPTDINGSFTNSPNATGDFNAYLVQDAGITSIQDLQYSPYPNNQTIWNNDSINGVDIRGIVTATNMTQGSTNILTVQNGTGPNSAIIVNRRVGDITGSWRVGDSVSITGFRIIESFGMTTLNSIAGSVISSGNALPAFSTLPIDTIAAISPLAARRPELAPYEGMLLKFDSVFVVNTNADAPSNFGEFVINHDNTKTTGLRVDDISTRLPDNFNNNLVTGQFMSKVQGILTLTFSNWKLQPRDSNDLDFSGAPDTEKPVITIIGNNPDSVLINTSWVDAGATASDNKDGDISSMIIVTGTVDTATAGTYTISYVVSDKAGNKDSVTRTVIVYQSVGLNQNELAHAKVNMFPNPANETIKLSVSGIKTFPLTASIIDISGRVLMSERFETAVINHSFNLNELNNGIYFCQIQSENGSRTIKFVVSK